MWTIESHDDVARTLKKFRKKWPHEVANVFANLDSVHKALEAGVKPEQLKRMGCVHSEPHGILAVDESGPGKGSKPKALRLYTYPDEDASTLHAIILGDKSTQSKDIQDSVQIVRNLRANRGKDQAEPDREAV